MKNLLYTSLLGFGMLFFFTNGFAQTHFTATLTGDQVNPAVITPATGTGVFLLTDEGLEFHITVEGLEITNAHFHKNAIGANGGVVRSIKDDFESNTASGIWKSSDETQPLTEELINDLLSGTLYVNVHTAANPGGEIRGQVIMSAGTGFTARLTGDQENPAVITDAKGTGVFTLTDAGLVYSLTIEGLDITNAHFHNNSIGANGGVVRSIKDDFIGNTAAGVWRITDANQPLTEELINDLLLGNLYVNVHTADNPGGEIRGQVNLSSGIGFIANLEGEQVVPPVSTNGIGTGSFTLTEAGLVFSITLTGLEVANAHFHNSAAGAGGGVVRGIRDDFNGHTASGVWRRTDSQPLTKELVSELLLGNIYVNIHTADNPGGEIRGQLMPNTGSGFTARLTGDQVNPPVLTPGSGTGAFMLTDSGLVFSITVDSVEITNAHFHGSATGANGGVVRGIKDDFVGNHASGIWKNSDTQPFNSEMLKELLTGNLYVNLHTAGNPGGEIRGQVNLSSGTLFSARLTGDQANPPVTTDAKGTGFFVLTDSGFVYSITVQNLEISNAHFHRNAIGGNGGVVRGIKDDFVGNTASGIWKRSDAQPLTDELVNDLLAGNLYINVHTAANPGGEIRGQVLLSEGGGFSARLTGTQEVPAINTQASGTGTFTLTDAGLVFHATVAGLEIANSHIHNAPFGQNGGVVRAIKDDFNGQTASGVWSKSDSQPLTPELMSELVLGNLYVNVHTADNPGGEIRGQLGVFDLVTSTEYVGDPLGNYTENSLLQNTPNPFHGSTEIQFVLRQSGKTVLRIYNLVGKEIATLVNEYLNPGTYKTTFEPLNAPSGFYIYRLEFNGMSIAKKMIFNK